MKKEQKILKQKQPRRVNLYSKYSDKKCPDSNGFMGRSNKYSNIKY